MNYRESVVLITGADGGIGRAIVCEMVNRSTKKIYVAGLNADKLQNLKNDFGAAIYPHVLDVTDAKAIAEAAIICSDVNVLINCAGVEMKSSFIAPNASAKALFEMKVNYVALIDMITEFDIVLQRNKPASIVNILSVGSVAVVKRLGTYCASKAAAHLLTESIRDEFMEKGICVAGVYFGYANTDMSKDVNQPKTEPEVIAKELCDGMEIDATHIFPDLMSKKYFDEYPISIQYFS